MNMVAHNEMVIIRLIDSPQSSCDDAAVYSGRDLRTAPVNLELGLQAVSPSGQCQRRAFVHCNVSAFIALDFVLWIVRARVMNVSLVINIGGVHSDDCSADTSRLRIPSYMVTDLEAICCGLGARGFAAIHNSLYFNFADAFAEYQAFATLRRPAMQGGE